MKALSLQDLLSARRLSGIRRDDDRNSAIRARLNNLCERLRLLRSGFNHHVVHYSSKIDQIFIAVWMITKRREAVAPAEAANHTRIVQPTFPRSQLSFNPNV